MKLLFNLKILVGLGRFLPLCGYVLQNHLVRHITAARCKVPPGPQMSAPKLPTQMRELHQQLVTGPENFKIDVALIVQLRFSDVGQ